MVDGNIKSIKHFFSLSITNQKTEALINRALAERGVTLGPWPGEEFSVDSVAGHALLGTHTPRP